MKWQQKAAGRKKITRLDRKCLKEKVMSLNSPFLKETRQNGAEGKGGGGDGDSPATFWSDILRLRGYQAHSR